MAIPESFHSDLYRQCREKLGDVSHGGLTQAGRLFPKVLERIIGSGDKISANEKDNITRHLLCSALETENVAVIDMFLRLGRRKVADFIKMSNDSTKDRVDGALSSFASSYNDRDYVEQVSDLIKGKRKSKSFLDLLFPHLASKENVEEP